VAIQTRNQIKIGKDAIKKAGGKYDPFLGKGTGAQRSRRLTEEEFGKPVPGSNPRGVQPSTPKHKGSKGKATPKHKGPKGKATPKHKGSKGASHLPKKLPRNPLPKKRAANPGLGGWVNPPTKRRAAPKKKKTKRK
jgi:hypothetical protein